MLIMIQVHFHDQFQVLQTKEQKPQLNLLFQKQLIKLTMNENRYINRF